MLREIKKNLVNTLDTAYGMGVEDVPGTLAYDPIVADSLLSRLADRPVPSYLQHLDVVTLRNLFRGRTPPLPQQAPAR